MSKTMGFPPHQAKCPVLSETGWPVRNRSGYLSLHAYAWLRKGRETIVNEWPNQWDYRFEPYDRRNMNEFREPLDTLGEQGWELVSVSDGYAFFKRPKR
jgi:hypothetical protein